MLDPYVSVQAPHDMAQLFLQVWKPEAPRRLAENPAAGFGLERQYLSEDAQLFRVGDLRGPQVVWKATGPHTTLGTKSGRIRKMSTVRPSLATVFHSALTPGSSNPVLWDGDGTLRSDATPYSRANCCSKPGLCGSSGSSVHTPFSQLRFAFALSHR